MHFVMKTIEIDFYSRRKLTQNQELSMKVIVLRRKAKKSRRNFRGKKVSRFHDFLHFSQKFIRRNLSKLVIRESLFPRKMSKPVACESLFQQCLRFFSKFFKRLVKTQNKFYFFQVFFFKKFKTTTKYNK